MTKKILIADDNLFIRSLVKAALAPMGYVLIEATDGREAVDAAVEQHPDLILLDVVMPHMDGFTALTELREGANPVDCAIAMLTTASSEADMQRGREAGANEYILKPFDKTELRATVASLLKD